MDRNTLKKKQVELIENNLKLNEFKMSQHKCAADALDTAVSQGLELSNKTLMTTLSAMHNEINALYEMVKCLMEMKKIDIESSIRR